MTIREALMSLYGAPLMTVGLLLLTAQLLLIFAAFRDKRSRKRRSLYLLHAVLTFICVYLPLVNQSWDIEGSNYPLPASLAGYGLLPVAWILIYEALSVLVLAACFRELYRYRREHPTFDSVKETMDLRPAGIAFGRKDGTVAFVNRTMNDLARNLTGKGLNDINVFLKACGGAGDTSLSLPDGSGVWQLSTQELEVEGETFVQLTAVEITEEAAIVRELEQRHDKLLDIHRRLDLYNRQAGRIIIAQELLTARMDVHNALGSVLLESRRYLRAPSAIDEEKLLQALRRTNTYLLREYEHDDSMPEPLAGALEMADAIGVRVELTGLIPAEEPQRGILAAAIRECATNTVKHAGGDRLDVTLSQAGDVFEFVMKSPGDPKGPIRESGGLASLRTLVEQSGGTMHADAESSAFILRNALPLR